MKSPEIPVSEHTSEKKSLSLKTINNEIPIREKVVNENIPVSEKSKKSQSVKQVNKEIVSLFVF